MASIFASLNTFPVEAGIINRSDWCTLHAWMDLGLPCLPSWCCLRRLDWLGHPTLAPQNCRERTSKAYHVSPYYLARFLCDLPLRLAQSLLFGECLGQPGGVILLS